MKWPALKLSNTESSGSNLSAPQKAILGFRSAAFVFRFRFFANPQNEALASGYPHHSTNNIGISIPKEILTNVLFIEGFAIHLEPSRATRNPLLWLS